MSTHIHKVDNANVYVNGNSFLGRAKSVTLPEFEIVSSDHTNLGLVGTIKLASGVKALEGEIVWDGYYPEVMSLAYNPYKNIQLMIRANVQVYNSLGREVEVPLVTTLNIGTLKTPLGEYKPKENAEFTIGYTAHGVKQVIDGKEVLYFDAFSNAYRVGGEDVLQRYRTNIGQ